jgi:hypothetical protein
MMGVTITWGEDSEPDNIVTYHFSSGGTVRYDFVTEARLSRFIRRVDHLIGLDGDIEDRDIEESAATQPTNQQGDSMNTGDYQPSDEDAVGTPQRMRRPLTELEELSAEHFEEVEKALDAAGVPPGGHYRVTKDKPKETT